MGYVVSTLCPRWKNFEEYFGSTSGSFRKYLLGYYWVVVVSFWNHYKGGFESTPGFQGKYLRGHCRISDSFPKYHRSICGILGE